jgi:hypothetical protein
MNPLSDARKAVRIAAAEGPAGLAERLTRKLSRHYASGEELYLQPRDVADSSRVRTPPPGPVRPRGTALEIGWVITAPAAGSGGHTTLFRFVEALEQAGHRCVLYVYDGHGGDAREYDSVLRSWWPGVRAEVRDVRDGLPALDAHVATAWQTAHVLARHDDVPGRRFYLTQDFEPYFYPRGSAYELAKDTYRFGFQPITVGHMVADELRARFGLESEVAEFGCDTRTYRVTADGPRRDVVFYAKPGIARRGYELGVLALERFHEMRPDVTVHTFGISARRLPFPAQVHAHMPPNRLNELYQQCAAGLALSFTNISLIAYELLAAGVVPVVNDWPGSRADLDNPHVEWARPTPEGLATALAEASDRAAALGPRPIGASVSGVSWEPARRTVVETIERACAGELSPVLLG